MTRPLDRDGLLPSLLLAALWLLMAPAVAVADMIGHGGPVKSVQV